MAVDDYDDPYAFYAPKNYFDEDARGIIIPESESAPAPLTDIPTSSLNASRPRTVAAGYDPDRKILTVVFRDGTVWNYDNVTPGEWENFHASISKGRPWLNDQLFGRGYPADLTGLDPAVYAELYSKARIAQVQFRTKRQYLTTGGKKVSRVGKGAVGKARTSVKGINPHYAKGKNPSKGGKNPF